MGNFTNIIIIFASISLVAGLLVMMAQDISAESNVNYESQFFGDYLFSQYDLNTQYMNGSQTSTDWNTLKTNLNTSDLPSQSTTGSATSSSGFQFPDWLNSGLSWLVSPLRPFLNVVGIPYTIIKSLNPDARILATLSGYFSTIVFIVFVMFILGREN